MSADTGASGPAESKKLYVPAEFEGENDNELPLDCDFVWEVKKFNKLVGPKVESPVFTFGSRQQFKWCAKATEKKNFTQQIFSDKLFQTLES
jgi:hypothetical protein